MTTFESKFCLDEASFPRRLGRDIRLLAYLLRIAWGWLIIGGRIRRAYKVREAEGKTYWIE